jgi:colanic acid biosynthesis glycosyl transferase WcaI
MKILIYSANFAPEPTGIGKYSGEMAAWLAAQGHEVRVVAAPPHYPAWKLADGYAWPPYRIEHWKGVDVWRAPLWVPEQHGGLKRILCLLSFAVSSLPALLALARWRPQVVLVVAPALVCAPGAWLTARLSGAKAWLHIQDFEVDVAFRMNLLRGKWLQCAVLGAERWLMRRFDVVSSISRKMVEHLAGKGVAAERAVLFPNWVDIDHIQPLHAPSAYRAELGIALDAVVLLFSGSLGNKQGLSIIPKVAERLRNRSELVFVICGDGVMKPELEQAAQRLPNLRLLPLQPLERLSDLLGMADAHLLTQSLDAEDLVLPSKLTGMLASGRPVIATCRAGTEIAEVVGRCGLVVAPEDDIALAAAVAELADAPERRSAMGAAARQLAEQRMSLTGVMTALDAQLQQIVRA